MSAKTAPRVTPLTVCWIRTSCQSRLFGLGGSGAAPPPDPPTGCPRARVPRIRTGGSGAAPPPDSFDLDRGGAPPLLPRPPPTGCPRVVLHLGRRGYSRMASNWNLQPMGPSDLTTLKPDMVS